MQLHPTPYTPHPTFTEVSSYFREVVLEPIPQHLNSRLRSVMLAGGIELIKIICPPLGIPIEMGRKWLETAKKVD